MNLNRNIENAETLRQPDPMPDNPEAVPAPTDISCPTIDPPHRQETNHSEAFSPVSDHQNSGNPSFSDPSAHESSGSASLSRSSRPTDGARPSEKEPAGELSREREPYRPASSGTFCPYPDAPSPSSASYSQTGPEIKGKGDASKSRDGGDPSGNPRRNTAKGSRNGRSPSPDTPQPRRVGTFTMGLALIVTGLLILALMFLPEFDFRLLFLFPPLLLIVLGAEIILRFCLSKNHAYRYDVFGIFLCFVLVCGSIGAACLPRVLEYWGPRRHQSEEVMTQQLNDELYQVLKDAGIISGADTHLYAEPDLLTNSDQDYLPSYTSVTLQLLPEFPDKESFAAQCRILMNLLQQAGLSQRLDFLEFTGTGPNMHYSLSIHDRFQWDLNEASLSELAEVVKLKPDPADGWLPGGYDEMLETFGPEVADAFLEDAIRRQEERIGTADNSDNSDNSGEEPFQEEGMSEEQPTDPQVSPDEEIPTAPTSSPENPEANAA